MSFGGFPSPGPDVWLLRGPEVGVVRLLDARLRACCQET